MYVVPVMASTFFSTWRIIGFSTGGFVRSSPIIIFGITAILVLVVPPLSFSAGDTILTCRSSLSCGSFLSCLEVFLLNPNIDVILNEDSPPPPRPHVPPRPSLDVLAPVLPLPGPPILLIRLSSLLRSFFLLVSSINLITLTLSFDEK